jgi:hypothetical protein
MQKDVLLPKKSLVILSLNSDGKQIPVRLIVEKHIIEDLGFIPSFDDWIKNVRIASWMRKGQHKL